MIDSFQLCFDDDKRLNVSLDGNKATYILENNEPALVSLYHKSKNTGVTWCYGQNRITLLESGVRIFGLPSPTMDKVIVIYPSAHSIFHNSRNAAIYNSDGSLSIQLESPVLISNYWKEYGKRVNTSELWYDHISWHKLENNEVVINMKIGFNRDWYEERVLNPDTGALEALIGAGRF